MYIYNTNLCDISTIANCNRVETAVFPQSQFVFGPNYRGCVEYVTDSLPVIKVPITIQNMAGLAESYNSLETRKSPNNRFLFMCSCVLSTNMASNLLPSATMAYCKYYIKVGTLYGCFKCKFGYTGVPITIISPG